MFGSLGSDAVSKTRQKPNSDVEVVFNNTSMHQLLLSEGGEVARHLVTYAVKVEGNAKRLCPVDTGRLRASISHQLHSDGDGVFAAIGTSVNYGPYVEFGTRRMAAQPFLRPALLTSIGFGGFGTFGR